MLNVWETLAFNSRISLLNDDNMRRIVIWSRGDAGL